MPTTEHPYDWLTTACRRDPTRTRFTFLADDGAIDRLDGQTIVDQSTEMAARLRGVAKHGDRILLPYPAGLDFVIGFLACVKADLLPVPVSYPKPRRTLSRYQTIVDDCDARLALTVQKTLALVDEATLSDVKFYSSETLPTPPIESTTSSAKDAELDRTVFLQYTSGSTSHPSGVCVTYGNLVANLSAIYDGFQIGAVPADERVVCSWLPAYHDMGLVGVILSALVHDGHAVLMSPTSYLQRPTRWLKAATDYKAKVTVAPNFGYGWAVSKIDPADDAEFDLSHLLVAACGAEPIDPAVLDRFSERFGARGFDHRVFYPCYGLAESTLLVTGADRGDFPGGAQGDRSLLPGPVTRHISRAALRDGRAEPAAGEEDAMRIVSSGTIAGDETTVVIADPATDAVLPDGRVGEIRVASASVAPGYWNHPEESAETFRQGAGGDDRVFLCTGDLGFTDAGELYVTGRLKDILIIRGQNHYPQDLERTAKAAHPALAEGLGAVFLVDPSDADPESKESRLVFVQEVDRGLDADAHDEVLRAIRLAIASEHDLAVREIVLIRPASLPRTSSGKVQRFRCRELYLADELRRVSEWKHEQSLDPAIFPDLDPLLQRPDAREAVCEQIADTLLAWLAREGDSDAPSVDLKTSFAEFGVDSVAAVELSRQMELWLGVQLSPVLAWSYPNVEKLSQYLTDQLMPEVEEESDASDDASIEALLAEIEGLDEDEAQAALERLEG